ncbi:regulator [Paraburkholderia phenoliruptrix]|uniref:regulator n=1 Tax=Paraburkholderia phenoliruptrix TaxID=252970 RepID=UPI001C6F2BD5|nr:regulator [Paraburkholderia phenoliruptrix]MBW9103768.1 regulator [Paraburkholderia phenoliruptrix]MBW9128325.1 regulator [Paraburkholderia ginsengiterrae]
MRSIMHANRLHLLLPFALPAAADAATALHDIRSAALDRLIARATLLERVIGEDFQRTLPHERWIARQFGATSSSSTGAAADEAPLAPYMLRADGGEPGDATWACVQPVHVRIAHDHLVLIDPASLELSDEEAGALLAVARPLIEELGVRIEAPRPARWYLSGDDFGTLAGASPLRASGRNIEIWLPHEAHSGERSRAWMKLQNEVQMAWFGHPVNEAREARGLPAVNSIWFHAQGAARPLRSPFTQVFSDAAATRGLAITADVRVAAPPASFAALNASAGANANTNTNADTNAPATTLVELDPFSAPYIQQDWARWNAAFAALQGDWFEPALAALESGALAELGLTLCGDTGSVTLAVTRGDLRKFWRRRVLASLFIE